MKRVKILTIVSVVSIALILLLALGSRAGIKGTDQSDSVMPEGGTAELVVPEPYQTFGNALDANVPAETVYFTPQDEETSTTVLFLYNTSDANATVGLQTFQRDGALFINALIELPAHQLVRICGDPVNTVSSGWWGAVLVNFKTFSAYAKLTLPAGVEVDGYVVWNNSSIYDPLMVAPTLNLRFSPGAAGVSTPAAAQNVIELTEVTFDQTVLGSDVPVLVDFWAPWCGPCLTMAPVIEEIAREYADKAKVCKLNTDNAPNIIARYNVTLIPTFILFKNGQIQQRWIGITPKEDLTAGIDALL